MSIAQAAAELRSEGLRIAHSNESGWAWTWIDRDGERITWWVTDAPIPA